MNKIAAVIAALAITAASATALNAADTRYSEWTGSQTVANVDQLVDRLSKLIDNAERQRAADPRFLRDLRDALDDYAEGQIPYFIVDDFRDGNYTKNPTWSVTSGKFVMERTGGIRSAVRVATSQSGNKDAASAILDTLLGGGNTGRNTRAEIVTPAKMTNTFSSTVMLESLAAPGRLDMFFYQGNDRSAGYRLIYYPDSTPSFELVRFNKRGGSVIESYDQATVLEDGNTHAIEWTRTAGGRMVVALDGEEIINTTDQGVKSGFDGLGFANFGGDYVIRTVEVRGSR